MTTQHLALTARAQRFPLHFPLRFRKSGMAHWQSGRTINISRTGILFKTDDALPKDSLLDIQVRLPMKMSIACQATVVRSEKTQFAVRIHHHRLIKKATNSTN
ncbi:MAG: PilZ domain-containing protein [Acidobacteria bacterium]|nr:PilZ domain-containing protein [Acidobacteriota bacterium]